MVGPITEEGNLVHAEKYRGEGEDFREAMNRVAASLQDSHEHYMEFREILLDMRFMPAGRIQAAMGSLKNITPYNCFVSGTIHDSFTDGPSLEDDPNQLSIMQAAEKAAMTMRQGGGIGYDFSTLRPSGDLIRGVQAVTDGPMAFARIFDAVCRATSSAGNRRGAQMLVMRVDHPDIERFIRAKHANADIPYEYRPLTGFNMSIGITHEFMEALAANRPFMLKFNGKDYREVDPVALWDMIMRSTYDWAEPGVLFIDTINEMNNLYYAERIAATNPCGEQPLPPHGACLLGSLNITKYLKQLDSGQYYVDHALIASDIPAIIRAMDNVVDRAKYPLVQQELEAKNKRRMGIGVTGVANALEACGYGYGTSEYLEAQDTLLAHITRHCYLASVELAQEKGAFPLFDADKYCAGKFIQTLDDDVQELIRRHGIRNSHLTSIAPTGTISFAADNVSSGIEPVFAYDQQRRVIMPQGDMTVHLKDYGVRFLGVKGRRAMQEVTALEHVQVLCGAQKHIDSACSKTCNVPTDYSYEDFKQLYQYAYENGAKGCTTYRPNGNYESVITSTDVEEEDNAPEACGWDPETGQRTGACAD